MIKAGTNRGFSLVELMIAMVVFGIGMAAAVGGFMPLVQNAKQQSKIAESAIEKNIGLDLLRMDLEQAGLGLPWFDEFPAWNTNYNEAAAAPASVFNDDGTGINLVNGSAIPLQEPRAIVVGNDVGATPDPNSTDNGFGINFSDYLVLKGTALSNSADAHKWSYITVAQAPGGGAFSVTKKDWSDATTGITLWNAWDDAFETNPSARVIAIKPALGKKRRVLMRSLGGDFFAQYGTAEGAYAPGNNFETFLLYGVDGDTDPSFPFNRADYYIEKNSVPGKCAPGTGVLVKAVISQNGGSRGGGGLTPLMDCVADFQVVLGWDLDAETDANHLVGTYTDGAGTKSFKIPYLGNSSNNETADLTAIQSDYLPNPAQLRLRLREIRVYILAQEGQMNINMEYGSQKIDVGQFGLGHDSPIEAGPNELDLKAAIGDVYKNYQWQVYTIVVTPEGLGYGKFGEDNI